MVFHKNSVQTPEMNRVLTLILNYGNTSGGGKKEKHTDFGVLPCGVELRVYLDSPKASLDINFLTNAL